VEILISVIETIKAARIRAIASTNVSLVIPGTKFEAVDVEVTVVDRVVVVVTGTTWFAV